MRTTVLEVYHDLRAVGRPALGCLIQNHPCNSSAHLLFAHDTAAECGITGKNPH